jgi:hypothetical protein
MNAMIFGVQQPCPHAWSATTRIDRVALAAAAASRRAQLRAIEASIEVACEVAVRRGRPARHVADRQSWDRRAWNDYTAEAVKQVRLQGHRISALRADAERLEHLVDCLT